jgi:hypothetical protein
MPRKPKYVPGPPAVYSECPACGSWAAGPYLAGDSYFGCGSRGFMDGEFSQSPGCERTEHESLNNYSKDAADDQNKMADQT